MCRKQGWATREEYTDIARRVVLAKAKAKAQLALKLAMDLEGRRKAFYMYIDNKRKAKENVYPLCNLVTEDMEKTEALSSFFSSISIRKLQP